MVQFPILMFTRDNHDIDKVVTEKVTRNIDITHIGCITNYMFSCKPQSNNVVIEWFTHKGLSNLTTELQY